MNLSEISSLSEDQAREYFEQIRWPNGPVCPHCGSVESTKLQGKAHRVGLYKCSGCGDQFTATIGTILEDSHLPDADVADGLLDPLLGQEGYQRPPIAAPARLGELPERVASGAPDQARHGPRAIEGLAWRWRWHRRSGRKLGRWQAAQAHLASGSPVRSRERPVPRKTRIVGLVERDGRARAHVIPDLTGANIEGGSSRACRSERALDDGRKSRLHRAWQRVCWRA